MYYSLSDYQTIPSNYVLPETVLGIISTLCNKFGASLPMEVKRHRTIKQNGFSKMNDESWQTMREFKPTVVVEKKDKLSDIRVALNKLSIKNYETTTGFLIEKINDLIQNEQDTLQLHNILMEIISTNKIFSPLYAKFYKTLVNEFPAIFLPTLESIQNNYIESISNIRYVDQNSNYDDFCKNNYPYLLR